MNTSNDISQFFRRRRITVSVEERSFTVSRCIFNDSELCLQAATLTLLHCFTRCATFLLCSESRIERKSEGERERETANNTRRLSIASVENSQHDVKQLKGMGLLYKKLSQTLKVADKQQFVLTYRYFGNKYLYFDDIFLVKVFSFRRVARSNHMKCPAYAYASK